VVQAASDATVANAAAIAITLVGDFIVLPFI
jgi:hypothetical protein